MLPYAKNGVNNGLELLLDAEAYDYASSPTGSEGFAISILHQLDIPIMKHTGVNIEPGQSIQVGQDFSALTSKSRLFLCRLE